MVSQIHPASETDIYPESDGKPIADNTKQFRWIVVIQQNLDSWFAQNPNVFVAGDLLWYPVQGNNTICTAPDVFVAFDRPKGDRRSYLQWNENNIAPQVVFEILSPSNTRAEMNRKLLFYDRYGVEEYYLYDPDTNAFSGWLRGETFLEVIESIANWTSPRLGIRFALTDDELQIYRPDGKRFLTYAEITQQLEQAEQQLEQAEQQLEQAEQQLEQERQRAEQERQRADRLAEQLRSMGVDPTQL